MPSTYYVFVMIWLSGQNNGAGGYKYQRMPFSSQGSDTDIYVLGSIPVSHKANQPTMFSGGYLSERK